MSETYLLRLKKPASEFPILANDPSLEDITRCIALQAVREPTLTTGSQQGILYRSGLLGDYVVLRNDTKIRLVYLRHRNTEGLLRVLAAGPNRPITLHTVMRGIEEYAPGSVIGYTDMGEAILTQKGRDIFDMLAAKLDWPVHEYHPLSLSSIGTGLRVLSDEIPRLLLQTLARAAEMLPHSHRYRLVQDLPILTENRKLGQHTGSPLLSGLRINAPDNVSTQQLRTAISRLLVSEGVTLESNTLFGRAAIDQVFYRHLYQQLTFTWWSTLPEGSFRPALVELPGGKSQLVVFTPDMRRGKPIAVFPQEGPPQEITARLLRFDLGSIPNEKAAKDFQRQATLVPRHVASEMLTRTLALLAMYHIPEGHVQLHTNYGTALVIDHRAARRLQTAIATVELEGFRVHHQHIVTIDNPLRQAALLVQSGLLRHSQIEAVLLNPQRLQSQELVASL